MKCRETSPTLVSLGSNSTYCRIPNIRSNCHNGRRKGCHIRNTKELQAVLEINVAMGKPRRHFDLPHSDGIITSGFAVSINPPHDF
jgi:hypothetical protein